MKKETRDVRIVKGEDGYYVEVFQSELMMN